jgi:hypothetical protein
MVDKRTGDQALGCETLPHLGLALLEWSLFECLTESYRSSMASQRKAVGVKLGVQGIPLKCIRIGDRSSCC